MSHNNNNNKKKSLAELDFLRTMSLEDLTIWDSEAWDNASATMVYTTASGNYIKFRDGRCYFDDGDSKKNENGTIDDFYYIPNHLIDLITIEDLQPIDKTTRYSTEEGGVLAFKVPEITQNGDGVLDKLISNFSLPMGRLRLYSLPLTHLKNRKMLISDPVYEIDKVKPTLTYNTS